MTPLVRRLLYHYSWYTLFTLLAYGYLQQGGDNWQGSDSFTPLGWAVSLYMASDLVDTWLPVISQGLGLLPLEMALGLRLALGLHHLLFIASYQIALHSGYCQRLLAQGILFELSSYPLMLYSLRLWTHWSLPLTWLSYGGLRVFWGNWLFYCLYLELGAGPGWLRAFFMLMMAFCLPFKLYYFLLLSRRMAKRLMK